MAGADGTRPEPSELLAAARAGFADPQADADDPGGTVAARVRLFRVGAVIAQGEASAGDALSAAGAAAAAAAREFEGTPYSRDGLHVETVDAVEPLTPAGLSGLLQAALPGRHGLLLRDRDQEALGWPFEALRDEGRQAAWVKRLNRAVRPPGARLASSTSVERFTTLEAAGPFAPQDDEYIPPRIAGFRLVNPDEVLPDRVSGAALQAAAWLLRHQLPSGLFAYEFQPTTQEWSPYDQLVRQCGCAWSLALVGRLTRDRGTATAAVRAMNGILSQHLRRDGPGRLYYLAQQGAGRLGAIPLLLLAALELEASGAMRTDREVVDQLTATLLAVQDRDGRLGTTTRGLDLEGSETYYAGQVVLALARLHAQRPKPRLRTAVERSLRHYHARWDDEDERDLSFTTWMLQACDVWYTQASSDSIRTLTRDYAYAMADWALEEQHPAAAEHPLWAGAFQNTPGIGTAAYAEGILSALAIARREEDIVRIECYRSAMLPALRFLLQLQVEASDAPFVGGRDQIGGVRSALHRATLRCDNAQHFLMTMLRSRALCWPDE